MSFVAISITALCSLAFKRRRCVSRGLAQQLQASIGERTVGNRILAYPRAAVFPPFRGFGVALPVGHPFVAGGANPRPRAFYAGCSRLSASGRDGSPPGGRPDGPAGRRPHSHSLDRRCCNTTHKPRSRRRQQLFRKLHGDMPFGGRLQRSWVLAVVLLGHQHCQGIAPQSFATIEARRVPQSVARLQR
jgi:hypothetical protein